MLDEASFTCPTVHALSVLLLTVLNVLALQDYGSPAAPAPPPPLSVSSQSSRTHPGSLLVLQQSAMLLLLSVSGCCDHQSVLRFEGVGEV